MSTIDVLVPRSVTHGIPAADYAAALRDRLPDHRIEVAPVPRKRQLAANTMVISSIRPDAALLDNTTELELFTVAAVGYDHRRSTRWPTTALQ
ncbi:hypothetical protein [Natrialba sp. PRR66]|uniref:hypothetical protein n=1 Tax=Natrialba sp. PRR66 TaxID=3098146 RepID=UPI002B1D17C4|nr:hypothetical protein [Natrialba sp. PRR66]